MKKISLILILLGVGSFCAYPQDSIVSIPDNAFLHALIERGVDANEDSLISYAEAEAITSLRAYGRIADLSGIEAFINLESLYCGGNLSSLDVSNNLALKVLDCYTNELTNLDVSNNTALEELICAGNLLTSLDVSNNIALKRLWCSDNQLSSLDVSNCLALQELICWGNQLSSLDVSRNIALESLLCSDNQLSSLDVSGNPALKGLGCGGNQLTNLDVSNCNALWRLSCDENQLSNLDVSKCFNLDRLYCEENLLVSLDVTGNQVLTNLQCHDNQLTSLDVSKNMALERLICGDNPLNGLDLTNNVVLVELDCRRNQLTSLDLKANSALTKLYCFHNELSSLDLSNNHDLESLYCESNQLSNLDVTRCVALERLSCEENQLSSLDVRNNFKLTHLQCEGNQLTSLDVSRNLFMESLNCGDNHITALDVSSNKKLKEFIYRNMPSLVRICGWYDLDSPGGIILNMMGSPNVVFTKDCEDIVVEIPDTAFLHALIDEGIDLNKDSLISTWEADIVTSLDVRWWEISDLTGIEAFVFLDSLDCSYNKLSTVDLSNNEALSYLDCSSNELLILDISNNSRLKFLGIRFNPDLTEVCMKRMPFPRYADFAMDVISYGSDNFYFSDCVAPELSVEHDAHYQPDLIHATCTEIAYIYLVPSGTARDMRAIRENCVIDSILISRISIMSDDPIEFEVPIPDSLPNGVYWLYARDMSGNISNEVEVVILGVGDENYEEQNLRIYPNPTSNILTIETGISGPYRIEITSLNGQVLLNRELEGPIHALDLSSIYPGVYFIYLRSEDFVTTRKIIKQ